MSVRLVIEDAPAPQGVMERDFTGGQLVIGRSDDADWQLHDPEMLVSRRHCVVSLEGDRVMATDASSGGLFVDNAANAVGAGNRVEIAPGMRLRLGDFVLRVEALTDAKVPEAETRGSGGAFDFGPPEPAPERSARPDTLPDPFGLRADRIKVTPPEDRAPPEPLDREDPFALNLSRAFERAEPEKEADPGDIFAGFRAPETPEPQDAAPVAPKPAPGDGDVFAALLRGMDLNPSDHDDIDPLEAAALIGRMTRDMTQGVMGLLRTRARAKQKARVAQTIIASADVNPLKFMATPQDALAQMIRPDRRGYLPGDAAVGAAFADLTDHQLRTWTALQSALRQMVDRFDPKGIVTEMEQVGMLGTLLAGGRSAKLWRLYEQRYRDIARTAERDFLGEVGADFRDAYEADQEGERP